MKEAGKRSKCRRERNMGRTLYKREEEETSEPLLHV